MDVGKKGRARAGEGGGQEQHRTRSPIAVFPGEVRLQAGPAGHDEGAECGTHEPGVLTARAALTHARNRVAIRGRDVGDHLGSGQSQTGEVAMGFRPLLRDDDRDVGRGWLEAREIQSAGHSGEPLELHCQRTILAVPGRHAPLGLLGRAQVGRLLPLLWRGIGIAPEIDSDASRPQAGVQVGRA